MFVIEGKYTTATVYTDNIEGSALAQINEMVNNPAFNAPIAIMPDVHAGKGSVIGFTMPYNGRIIPSVVGVDIGCGVTTMIFPHDEIFDSGLHNIKNHLEKIDQLIRKVVPVGFNKYHIPVNVKRLLIHFEKNRKSLASISDGDTLPVNVDYKYISDLIASTGSSGWYGCGSLGGGNHFIEISSVSDSAYISVHSGSRHFGLKVCEKWDKFMSDNNLPYLEGKDALGYLIDMCIAQEYAHMNRSLILDNICNAINDYASVINSKQIKTVHNYISIGSERVIIRKGAVSAMDGELFQIPLNMASGTLYCIGKGNPDWNYSAPHGAGRLYSRAQAKKTLSLEEFEKQMDGVYVSNLSKGLLDESPMAYKSGDEISAHITDTAIIQYRSTPILNIKG